MIPADLPAVAAQKESRVVGLPILLDEIAEMPVALQVLLILGVVWFTDTRFEGFINRTNTVNILLIAIPLLALVDLAFVPGPSVFVALFLALFMTSAGRTVIVREELLPVGAGVVAGAALGALLLSFLDLANMAPVFGGVILVADGLGQHIPRGYIYFALGFSVFVEMLNLRVRKKIAA